MEKIVLAHSGTLRTLVAIPWLADTRGAEIVTVTLDLGQAGSLEDVHERALAMGAARSHIVDARERFAHEYLLPVLHASARGGAAVSRGALTHAIVAQSVVEIARIEGAGAVAFSGDPALIRALDPSLDVVAVPAPGSATWESVMARARGRGVPLPQPVPSSTSESGTFRFRASRTPAEWPAELELAFEAGVPVSISGVAMAAVELMTSLDVIAATHGLAGDAPSVRVLQDALASLAPLKDDLTGVVTLRLHRGACAIEPAAAPALAVSR